MNSRIARWVNATHRSPKFELLLSAACALVAAAGLFGVQFDQSLASFFPPESGVARALTFLGDASFADKVAISFARADTGASDEAFLAYTDAFATRIAAAPGIRGVLANVSTTDYQQNLERFFALAPQWLTRADLEELKDRVSDEGVEAALKRRYRQSLKPEGSFLMASIQNDPLGLFEVPLLSLGRGAMRMGYEVNVAGGRLMSRDGRHRLIVLDTDVPVANVSESKRLLDHIARTLGEPPTGVSAEVISGHAHSVSNQDVIQHDIQRASVLSAVAFAALFILFYRDWRVVAIGLVPIFAVLIALPTCSILFGRMTFLVAAFGPIIVGLTDDYSIHVYMAARRGEGNVRALVIPIWAGMLTTLAVFLSFFVSSAAGFRQLAGFGSLAITAAFFFAVCALPHLVKKTEKTTDQGDKESWTCKEPPRWALGIGAILLVLGMSVGVLRLRFDTDFSRMNGARQPILEAETRFQKIWGKGDSAQAIVAVKVADFREADDVGAQLFSDICAQIGRESVSGFSEIVPSPKQRAANLADWRAFWAQDERAEAVRARLITHGEAFGFSEHAFEPFNQLITSPSEDTTVPALGSLATTLRERFVRPSKSGGGYAVVYVPDRPDILDALKPFLRSHPEAVCVSRQAFSGEIGTVFSADISRVACVAALLLLLSAWVSLRDIRQVVAALIPVVVAGGVLFGTMGLLDVPINIAHLMAGIVVLGVSFDYGVFILHIVMGRLDGHTRRDVWLCLLTTLAGSAPLITSQHPVLFSLGLALTFGVASGYLAAVLFEPTVCRKLGLSALLVCVLLGTGGCVSPLPTGKPFVLEASSRAQLKALPTNSFEVVQTVMFNLHGRIFSGFGVTHVDPQAGAFKASCMTPQGMTLFDLAGSGDVLETCRVMPELERLGDVGATIAQDIRHVFLDNAPDDTAVWYEEDGNWTAVSARSGGALVQRFSSKNGHLLEKVWITNQRTREWGVTYSDYGVEGPQRIVLKNHRFRYAYTLTMRIKEWSNGKVR